MDIERMKTHIKDYRERYIIGAVSALTSAGITYVIMRGRYAGMLSVPGTADQMDTVFVRPFAFLSRQTTNVVTVFEREGRGHPGYITQCLETGETWMSQKDAAKAFNGSCSMLSLHLRGKLSDFEGMHFERIAA